MGSLLADDVAALIRPGCPLGDGDSLSHSCSYMLMTFTSGSNFVIKGMGGALGATPQARSILELLTGTQLRHPDDYVEGRLWDRKQGHAGTKVKCPSTHAVPRTTNLEITLSIPVRWEGARMERMQQNQVDSMHIEEICGLVGQIVPPG